VPFRVEICGGISSGKTTLATLLQGDGDIVYENFQAVPFWQKFYSSPRLHAFETELSFLLQHYHQVKQRTVHASGLVVCDFSFWLDAAYAQVSLDGGKLAAFRAVWRQVLLELGQPQLIVRLECSPQTELRRVQARGRDAETSVSLEFLQSLENTITGELLAAQSVPLLAFDSDKQNFAFDSRTQEQCRRIVLARVELEKSTRKVRGT